MSYLNKLATLRAAAMADIAKHTATEGETEIRDLIDGDTIILKIDPPYLVIDGASATVVNIEKLARIADLLNSAYL